MLNNDRFMYKNKIPTLSVLITSSLQVYEVPPFTTALIGHTYPQYQRPNVILCGGVVSVAVLRVELLPSNCINFTVIWHTTVEMLGIRLNASQSVREP